MHLCPPIADWAEKHTLHLFVRPISDIIKSYKPLWRKAAGVEPTRERLTPSTGFETRTYCWYTQAYGLAATKTWDFAGFLMLYMLTVVRSVKAEKHTPFQTMI